MCDTHLVRGRGLLSCVVYTLLFAGTDVIFSFVHSVAATRLQNIYSWNEIQCTLHNTLHYSQCEILFTLHNTLHYSQREIQFTLLRVCAHDLGWRVVGFAGDGVCGVVGFWCFLCMYISDTLSSIKSYTGLPSYRTCYSTVRKQTCCYG